jgi:Zn-finger nucleic acid-binding protein
MFAGMEFCPHCGAKGSRTVYASAPALRCPGCMSDMGLVTVGTTKMHECSACASLWLDAATFTQLCTVREERGAVAAFIDVEKGTTTPRTAPLGAVRYVPCPVCAKLMNRQNFGHRSGVVIDVCKGHGVWFEHNELRAALRFIDSGGFERARQAEEQRQAVERAKLLEEFNAADREFRQLDLAERMRAGRPSGRAVEPFLGEILRTLFS